MNGLIEIPPSVGEPDCLVVYDLTMPSFIIRVDTKHLVEYEGDNTPTLEFFITKRGKTTDKKVFHTLTFRLDCGVKLYYPIPMMPESVSVWTSPTLPSYGLQVIESTEEIGDD